MNPVFADAVYWIALFSGTDTLHEAATTLTQNLGSRSIVTSQMVLTEYLDGAAERGANYRREAALNVRLLMTIPNLRIVPQIPQLFDAALTLYEQRADKKWSLTDCASLAICRQENIHDVLTHDYHFTQMGLNVLL